MVWFFGVVANGAAKKRGRSGIRWTCPFNEGIGAILQQVLAQLGQKRQLGDGKCFCEEVLDVESEEHNLQQTIQRL